MFHKYYDEIYSKKDYKFEVDTILSMIDYKPNRILDIGCGTGNHTMEFFNRGFKINGIDNDPKMIDVAKTKNPDIFAWHYHPFYPGQFKNFDLSISMFNVINYIDDLEELINFFESTFFLTNKNFIFDCWNGVAAMIDLPKRIWKEDGKFKIHINPTIDLMNQTVEIENKIYRNEVSFNYNYKQTLWTPRILKEILKMVGFRKVEMFEWMNTDFKATEKAWKIMVKCDI
jgi:SAM-dependent methyltransferase